MNRIHVLSVDGKLEGVGKRLISISIYLPNDSTKMLYDSALLSTRSKRQEATIRLMDHLNAFPSFSLKGKRHYYTVVKGIGGSTGINLQISEAPNLLLTISSQREGHSKRIEAALRIVDHLYRYESIATIGKRFNR